MKASSTFTMVWLLVAIAVLCNAGAQLLIKRGAPAAVFPLVQWLDLRLLAAVFLYGLSFFFTALVYARLPLSLVSPLMAGAIFVLVSVGAAWLFGETLGSLRLSGAALVLLGIALLARDM